VAETDLYLQHRDVIERGIAFVCRRHHLSRQDAEDFASTVRLRLIDADSAVLRAFCGRSSMQTYLVTVVTHQFQDWRNAQRGKWRPSAEALRMGPLGVLLETRLVRDRLSMDEAVEMLRTQNGVTEPRPALEAMAGRFPSRPGRTFVDPETLDKLEAGASANRADSSLNQAHARAAAKHASSALELALRNLEPQNQIILRMRFDDNLSVAQIGRILNLEQKPLYRRLERLLTTLRAALESAGFDAAAAADVLEYRGFDLAADAGESGSGVRLFTRDAGSPSTSGRFS
jgi:RNA polymerase sigma factor (sigma-70 family)